MVAISKLKWELQHLKKLDGGSLFRSAKYLVFGSADHKYKLHPCLSETNINDFEAKHAIHLPKDFRDFLLVIGNGGAGPGYGLLKIYEWDKELEIEFIDFLSTPFPYNDKWNISRPDDVDSDLYYEREEFQQWENEYFDNKHITGSIRLSHYGCAIYYCLVVTGTERGYVWVDDRANDYGLYPATSKITNEKMTFSHWYHEWLEESLESFKSNAS